MTWKTMDSAPKDGTVIQGWHVIHHCPISIMWNDSGFPFKGERLNWMEKTYTHSWPERAFSHWMPLPPPPETES